MTKSGAIKLLENSAIITAFAIPLIVAFAGLRRSYDAIPDQDLLWLSEALRLFRNFPPTYTDHPGIYWSLSYLLKLKFLSLKGFLGIIETRPGIPIEPWDAQLVINLSRFEQGIICGLCAVGTYFVMVLAGTRKALAIPCMLIIASSPGLLWESVQIRNESTSYILALIFCGLIIARARSSQAGSYRNRGLAYVAIISAIAAFYCKIQVIVLIGIMIPAILYATNGAELFRIPGKIEWKDLLSCILFSCLAWLLSISNWSYTPLPAPFRSDNLIFDLGLWLYVNLCLGAACASGGRNKELFFKETAIFTSFAVATQAILARFIFHPTWSAVILMPYSSIAFASKNFGTYSPETYYFNFRDMIMETTAMPPWMVIAAFSGLIISSLLNYFSKGTTKALRSGYACLLSGLMMGATSLPRFQYFYTIYIVPPILYGLAMIFQDGVMKRDLTAKGHMNARVSVILSLLIVIGIGLRSAASIADSKRYYKMKNTENHLCYQQQMDSLMSKTSVATCKDFERFKKE